VVEHEEKLANVLQWASDSKGRQMNCSFAGLKINVNSGTYLIVAIYSETYLGLV
jgi:hypothetical protein